MSHPSIFVWLHYVKKKKKKICDIYDGCVIAAGNALLSNFQNLHINAFSKNCASINWVAADCGPGQFANKALPLDTGITQNFLMCYSKTY